MSSQPSTSSVPLTPDTPLSPPLDSPRDYVVSHPTIADPASYHYVPPETIYTDQLYIRQSDSSARVDALHHEDHSSMPFLACPTPMRSYMSFGSHSPGAATNSGHPSEPSYGPGYDSPILRSSGDSQGNLYHNTGIPSPSHPFSSPGALDIGPGMTTFDSVEFQTLREHNVNTSATDPYAM